MVRHDERSGVLCALPAAAVPAADAADAAAATFAATVVALAASAIALAAATIAASAVALIASATAAHFSAANIAVWLVLVAAPVGLSLRSWQQLRQFEWHRVLPGRVEP